MSKYLSISCPGIRIDCARSQTRLARALSRQCMRTKGGEALLEQRADDFRRDPATAFPGHTDSSRPNHLLACVSPASTYKILAIQHARPPTANSPPARETPEYLVRLKLYFQHKDFRLTITRQSPDQERNEPLVTFNRLGCHLTSLADPKAHFSDRRPPPHLLT